jgi:hypothetical protein
MQRAVDGTRLSVIYIRMMTWDIQPVFSDDDYAPEPSTPKNMLRGAYYAMPPRLPWHHRCYEP